MGKNAFESAAELRRAIAEEEKRRPKSLKEVPHEAQTGLIMPPAVMPRRHADMGTLSARLEEKFGVSLDTSKYKTITGGNPVETVQLLNHLVENDETLFFKNGLLRFEESSRSTPIRLIVISTEEISATVIGSTTESDWIAQKVLEEVWAAAGAQRNWEQLKSGVQLKSNTTLSEVELGRNLIDLLNPAFRSFIDDNITATDAPGSRMGKHPFEGSALGRRLRNTTTAHVESIDLKVTVYDDVSGRSEDCKMRFAVGNRLAFGRGLVLVMSELDSPSHTALIQKLVETVDARK